VSGVATVQKELIGERRVVTEYATLVKRIARHVMSRLPASVQLDDLVQASEWAERETRALIGTQHVES